MPATYNILIMGASYGSLLASKILFGGHNDSSGVPAGRGRPDQCRRFSRAPAGARAQGRGRTRLAQAARQGHGRRQPPASIPRTTTCRARDAGAAISLARRARTARRRRPLARAVHVDHEHAAAAVRQAHSRAELRSAQARLHRPQRLGQFRSGLITLCSPDPQAIRPPEEKVNVLLVTLPTNFKVARFRQREVTPRSCASWSDEIDAVRYRHARRQDRAAG